jgi:hypothetical protein
MQPHISLTCTASLMRSVLNRFCIWLAASSCYAAASAATRPASTASSTSAASRIIVFVGIKLFVVIHFVALL